MSIKKGCKPDIINRRTIVHSILLKVPPLPCWECLHTPVPSQQPPGVEGELQLLAAGGPVLAGGILAENWAVRRRGSMVTLTLHTLSAFIGHKVCCIPLFCPPCHHPTSPPRPQITTLYGVMHHITALHPSSGYSCSHYTSYKDYSHMVDYITHYSTLPHPGCGGWVGWGHWCAAMCERTPPSLTDQHFGQQTRTSHASQVPIQTRSTLNKQANSATGAGLWEDRRRLQTVTKHHLLRQVRVARTNKSH